MHVFTGDWRPGTGDPAQQPLGTYLPKAVRNDPVRKTILLTIFGLVFAIIILPALIVLRGERKGVKVETGGGPLIKVLNVQTNKIENLPLEEYILGVVAAEMPAEFEEEALKAQAVAARTYTIKRFEASKKNPNKEHPQVPVCTDSTHCQAYVTKEEMSEKWGMLKYPGYYNKLVRAVNETAGVVLVYEGKLIDPVYHSTGTGKTENSGDVWQFDIPYLQSVDSPGDQESPKFKNEHKLTFAQVDSALGTSLSAHPASTINNPNNSPIKILEKTATGRVKRVKVGNKEFHGEEIRVKLGLNSTHFSWRAEEEHITFVTTGYGHGVGMSQYGANYFAKEGMKYKDILSHYYTGTELRKYNSSRQ
jgi:stage II sporulation protein D